METVELFVDADESSFSDTGSEWEEHVVAPAQARPAPAPAAGGEGAAALPRVPVPSGAEPGADGARPVAAAPAPAVRDVAWRNSRRTLEWRCRWVELRMRELRSQEAHYQALEARLLQRKRLRDEQPTQEAAAPSAEGEAPPVRAHDEMLHLPA